MESPYHPYGTLAELLAAAGVTIGDMGHLTTKDLLRRAADRASRNATNPAPDPAPPPPDRRPTGRPKNPIEYVTITVRIPLTVKHTAQRRADDSRQSLNAYVASLIEAGVK